jgi:ribosomal protein L32
MSWWGGEQRDPETGENHLAHAICCVAFLLEEEEEGPEEDM